MKSEYEQCHYCKRSTYKEQCAEQGACQRLLFSFGVKYQCGLFRVYEYLVAVPFHTECPGETALCRIFHAVKGVFIGGTLLYAGDSAVCSGGFGGHALADRGNVSRAVIL